MAKDDFDITSDLNANEDRAVPTHKGSVDATVGAEPAVSVNEVSNAKTPKADGTATDKQERTPPKAKSLRDQISSALKGEAETPPAAQQDGRPRNTDGTFAPKAAVPSDAASGPTGADVSPQPAGSHAAGTVAAPLGFTAQEAQVFAQLPPELQTSVARTVGELREKEARFAGLEQLIAPRREAWALNGVTEVQAVNQLLALSDYAARDPQGFIQYFAQQRNIDLEALVLDTDPIDPEIQALRTQVQTLEQQLNGFNSQQQQQAHQNTVNEITAFASETGTDGKPLRPYFEELGHEILPFIQAAMQRNPTAPRQQILQDAYDAACWGNAAVRAKMQEAANAAAEAQRIKEQQERAAAARRAGASIGNGVPDNPAAPRDNGAGGTVRDAIKASMAALS